MPSWTRHLHDWAETRSPWPTRATAITFGPSFAARDLPGPVPWCAPSVWLAAEVRPPRRGGRASFALAGLTANPVPPVETAASGIALRLLFRLPTPGRATVATLTWRGHAIGRVTISVVGEPAYRAGLTADSGVVARLGRETVSAHAVVARQCRGLLAALTLSHPDGLTPLTTLPVRADYARPGLPTLSVPVSLDAGQLCGQSLTVAVARPSPGLGRATITWFVGETPVTTDTIHGVSARRFRRHVRVAESGFVIAYAGILDPVRHPPSRWEGPTGPRFSLAGHPGWAGLIPYEVRATGHDTPSWGGHALVTGEPKPLPLGLVTATELIGFELRIGGTLAGTVVARPVPSAHFNAEGKFTPPPDFPWTGAADDELTDRLGRLG